MPAAEENKSEKIAENESPWASYFSSWLSVYAEDACRRWVLYFLLEEVEEEEEEEVEEEEEEGDLVRRS